MEPNEKRYGLVIGCSKYEDPKLSPLEATSTDIADLESVLADPAIGAFTELKVIADQPEYLVRREIDLFLRAKPVNSMMMIYITGHGIKDMDGKLYFAARDTQQDALESTAISAAWISSLLDKCSSERRLLVLDCCYAGAFPDGVLPKSATLLDDIQQVTPKPRAGRALVVMTASSDIEYSFVAQRQAEAIEGAKPSGSIFTRHFVEGLRSGDADLNDDGIVTHDELFDYISDKVRRERPGQNPHLKGDLQSKLCLSQSKPKRGEDIHAELEITPAEQQNGTTKNWTRPDGSTLKVTIPSGATSLTVQGQGGKGRNGAPNGDLVLSFRVVVPIAKPGANVYASIELTSEEAASGCTKAIETLDGVMMLAIPPATKDSVVITVQGRGRPGEHGGTSGDLLVTCKVANSTNSGSSIKSPKLFGWITVSILALTWLGWRQFITHDQHTLDEANSPKQQRDQTSPPEQPAQPIEALMPSTNSSESQNRLKPVTEFGKTFYVPVGWKEFHNVLVSGYEKDRVAIFIRSLKNSLSSAVFENDRSAQTKVPGYKEVQIVASPNAPLGQVLFSRVTDVTYFSTAYIQNGGDVLEMTLQMDASQPREAMTNLFEEMQTKTAKAWAANNSKFDTGVALKEKTVEETLTEFGYKLKRIVKQGHYFWVPADWERPTDDTWRSGDSSLTIFHEKQFSTALFLKRLKNSISAEEQLRDKYFVQGKQAPFGGTLWSFSSLVNGRRILKSYICISEGVDLHVIEMEVPPEPNDQPSPGYERMFTDIVDSTEADWKLKPIEN